MVHAEKYCICTMFIFLCFLFPPLFADSLTMDFPAKVGPQVQLSAQPFNLNEVKLLDGPFKKAMELNAEWLLSLEPDRFLAWFRKEAGLEPKAEVYVCW